MKAKRYFWQPELSLSIIYWSVVGIILFFGLILTLENSHPYLTGNLVMGLAIIAFLIGCHRYFKVTKQTIEIRYARLWKKEQLAIKQIKQITVGKDGILIETDRPHHFLMAKKQRQKFIARLEQEFPKLKIKTIDAKVSCKE